MITYSLPYNVAITAITFTIASNQPLIFPTFNYSSVRYSIQFWDITGQNAYAFIKTPQNFNNPVHLNEFCNDVVTALNFCYPTNAQIITQSLTGNFLNVEIIGPILGVLPYTSGNLSVTIHDSTDHFFSVSSIYY